jgi:hypothetical protein
MERTIEAAKLKAQRAAHERLIDLQKRGVVTVEDFGDSHCLTLAQNDAAIAGRGRPTSATNSQDRHPRPHDGTHAAQGFDGRPGRHQRCGQTAAHSSASAVSQSDGRTNINEIDVARLKVGDIARARRFHAHRRWPAASSGSPRARGKQSTGLASSVDVVLEEVDERLRPGMSATVIFTLARVEDTLAVALSAVFTAEARYVFMKKGEGFAVHAVKPALRIRAMCRSFPGWKDAEVARTRP